MSFIVDPGIFSVTSGSNPYGLVGDGGVTQYHGNGTFSLSVNYPSGIKPNDILIIHSLLKAQSGDETLTVPPGWSLLYEFLEAAYLHNAIWKRATGSESGSVSVTSNTPGTGSDVRQQIMTAWGGCVTTGTPFTTPQHVSATSGTTVTAGSVTTTAANQIVLNLLGTVNGDSTWTPPAGYTEVYDIPYNTGFAISSSANYKVYASAGATGTQDSIITETNRHSAISFALIAA
jgi:hypothetical protein